jgi:phosphoglycerate dehydrogenase-like enzyme
VTANVPLPANESGVAGPKPHALWWHRPGSDLSTLMSTEDQQRLRAHVDLVLATVETIPRDAAAAVAAATRGVEIVISGWGAPDYDDAVLAACPDLRLIVKHGGSIRGAVGDSAWARGIAVSTAVDAQGQLMADLVLSLTLAGLHQFPLYVRHQWGVESMKPDHGPAWPQRSLHRKTVGIYGFGAIGRHTARLLAPWECRVLAYDPYAPDDALSSLNVTRATSLHELCAASDVLAVVVADTPATLKSVGGGELAALHDGALIVHISRGEIVDLTALEPELRAGRLFACFDNGLNDYYGHPERLRYAPGLFLTPSISSQSDGVPGVMGRQVVDEVIRYARGEPLQHAVRREHLATRA